MMSDDISKGTAQGLIDYLDSLIEKGRVPRGSVRLLITAAKTILTKTEGEELWSTINVMELDIDELMLRFKNLTLGSYREESYDAYQSRFSKAIDWYRTFLANPGWVPKTRERKGSMTSERANIKRVKNIASHPKAGYFQERPGDSAKAAGDDVVSIAEFDVTEYPFPLANGMIAKISIPYGITKADVKRLAIFLEATVIEGEGNNDEGGVV